MQHRRQQSEQAAMVTRLFMVGFSFDMRRSVPVPESYVWAEAQVQAFFRTRGLSSNEGQAAVLPVGASSGIFGTGSDCSAAILLVERVRRAAQHDLEDLLKREGAAVWTTPKKYVA